MIASAYPVTFSFFWTGLPCAEISPTEYRTHQAGENVRGAGSLTTSGAWQTVAVIDVNQFVAFVAAASVIIATPGPNVLFIISRSIVYGRRDGIATVIGSTAGMLLQILVVALGLGQIVERSIAVFTVLKFVGAVYLMWLGIQTFRHRRDLGDSLDQEQATKSAWQVIKEGFVVGFANPKSIIFLAAILPQFTVVANGRVGLQTLLLGITFVVIATLFNLVLVVGSGAARSLVKRSPERLAAVGGVGGIAMFGIGLRLALTQRSD